MKISEMTNNQATDILVKITPAVANIADDEELVELAKELTELRKLPVTKIVSKILPRFVMFAMKNHKEDLYEIVGALAFKSTEEVGDMTVMETMNLLKESIDKDLLDFFKSFGSQESEIR